MCSCCWSRKKSRRAMKTTIDRLPILTLSRDRSRGQGKSVCSLDDVSFSLLTSSIKFQSVISLSPTQVTAIEDTTIAFCFSGIESTSNRFHSQTYRGYKVLMHHRCRPGRFRRLLRCYGPVTSVISSNLVFVLALKV